jgi:DNA helicase-2/ATP-dependent DNA helicase PcrA
MLDVSDFLETKQSLTNGGVLPAINHEVAFETAGPSLAAVLIAELLESGATNKELTNRLICDLCEYIRGRKGDSGPNRTEREISSALIKYTHTGRIRGPKRRSIVDECARLANECKGFDFSGDPGQDWLSIRDNLANSSIDYIKQVAIDAKYLRLLHKGAVLRSSLAQLWRSNGDYSGAVQAVRNALLQEHFAASTKVWTGIQVMTIHKAKGKEFDEVIIYEGYHQGRIVRYDADSREIHQSTLKLRVAVARAMKRATILSPSNDMCSLLR